MYRIVKADFVLYNKAVLMISPRIYFKKTIVWVRRNRWKTALIVAILLLAFFFLRPRAAKPVAVEHVTKSTVTSSLSVTGSIASDHQVDLSFLTSGKLTYLPILKGDHVRAGQVIAQEDTRSVQDNLTTALKTYSSQRNTFEQTQDNNKNNPLTDTVKRILQNNQYDLDKSVVSVDLQDAAKQNSVLTSPIDGFVTRLDVTAAGVNVTPATVFEVTDLDHLTFNMDVDQADIGKIVDGLPVRMTLDSFPTQTLTFPVDSIDYASHATSTGGTAYTVTLKIPANEGTQYRVGMSGDADIILKEHRNVINIPLSSLVDNSSVLVKTKTGFEKRHVTLGLQNDTNAEVVSGLSEGEVIAIQPSSVPSNEIKK